MLPEARGHASGYVADLVAFLDASFIVTVRLFVRLFDYCTVVCYTVRMFDTLYGCLLHCTVV